MKPSQCLTAAAFLALLLPFGAGAQTRYNAQPQNTSVKVDGTSTTHDWEMEGHAIGGFVEFAAGVALDESQGPIAGLQDGKIPISKAVARIKVNTIHSKAEHMPEVMDNLMQAALSEPTAPWIVFTLKEMTPKDHAAGKPFDVVVSGDLEIAGVTNAVSFPVSIEATDADHLRITGSVPLKMTDYKITPPAPNIGLGLMRCGDPVTIIIDWSLKKRKAS